MKRVGIYRPFYVFQVGVFSAPTAYLMMIFAVADPIITKYTNAVLNIIFVFMSMFVSPPLIALNNNEGLLK